MMPGKGKQIKKEFAATSVKQQLDLALEYAQDGDLEKTLEQCETAKQTLPESPIAYNYLGLVYQTADQFEQAIAAYQNAIRIDPRFYAARENLASARKSWEAELYRLFSQPSAGDVEAGDDETAIEIDESQTPESEEPLPQWLYLDEKAFLLGGWPGHRFRQGRIGLDPLDSDFESAHVQGTIVRALLTGRFRTNNPFYLVLMAVVGFFCFCPIFLFGLGGFGLIAGIINSPYWIGGGLLLSNVVRSILFDEEDGYEDNGDPFY